MSPIYFIFVNLILSASIHQIVPLNADSAKGIRPDSTDHENIRNKNARVLLLPIIFRSPDTGFAAGVLPQIIFRNALSDNPSSIRLDAYYTQKRQYSILLRPALWLKGDRINLTARFALKDWPTSYYGIGNNTPPGAREQFTERTIETSIEGKRLILPGTFAGVGYSFRYGNIITEDDRGELNSGTISGTGRTLVSGFKGVLVHDTRDNHFFPGRGVLHRFEFFAALTPAGSDHGFIRSTIDLRYYIPLNSSHLIAMQAIGVTTTGDVPFRMLSSVGNDLRGYSSVRHIDRHMMALQLEYRVVPVAWRLGFTVFAGAGDVFHHVRDIRPDRIKYSAGIGIRYVFSKSEKINIRLDYGFGRKSSGDYIDITESF
jgi:outer membrane protein assembly factor BamA